MRLAWLLVSGVWFIKLQLIPVLQWARFPTFDLPRGFDLWIHVLRDWRHGWLLFATLGFLASGFILEITEKRAAAYINVGFYAAYVLLWLPSLVASLRSTVEPEGVAYMVAFGGSALVTMTINYLLYRSWRRARPD